MNLIGRTNEVIDCVREKTDTAIVFCSFGKDSLVLLDLLYPKFKRLVCVFMYFVPHLEHVDMYIRWAQARYPKLEIVQVPHWNLAMILRSGLFCVANPDVKRMTIADVNANLQFKYGIKYSFYGMKKADGLNRRLMLKTYEKDNYINKNGNCYPLADWTQKDVLAYMKQKKLPMPVRYSKKASGGVGFNEECFVWLRENYPKDLQKILKVFPMSAKILYDYDRKQGRK
jgi:3'-phosphoadenosine 5'-phosphosulfate sulfotransferase (PAPS reductase)/FAD synthetase